MRFLIPNIRYNNINSAIRILSPYSPRTKKSYGLVYKGLDNEQITVLKMKCTYCGSNELVWRYEEGYIVCSKCGTVLDRIYDYNIGSPLLQSESNTDRLSIHRIHEDYIMRSRRTKLLLIDLRYRKFQKKLKEYPKLRPGLKIRDDVLKALYAGRNVKMVKTIVNEHTEEVKSKLLESKDTKIYLDIIEVFKEYPRISSRTDRVKLALAKILYNELVYGFRPSFSSIAKEFRVSVVNLRKAYKDLRRYSEVYVKAKNIIMSTEGYGGKVSLKNKGVIKQVVMGSTV